MTTPAPGISTSAAPAFAASVLHALNLCSNSSAAAVDPCYQSAVLALRTKHLRALIDLVQLLPVRCDQGRVIAFLNESASIFGYLEQALLGRSLTEDEAAGIVSACQIDETSNKRTRDGGDVQRKTSAE